MQHRTKDLFCNSAKSSSSISVGATKVPLAIHGHLRCFPAPPGTPDGLCTHGLNMALNIGFRFAINHRTISVVRRPGLPIRHSAIAPRAFSTCGRQSHLAGTARAAPKTLTRTVERRGQYIHDDLFGRAEESTIIAFMPPVSAMSGIGDPERPGGWRYCAAVT